MVRWSFANHHVSRSLTVPKTTILDIPPAEQAQMRAALRRARYGYLLALHVILLCAAGRTPTEIATVLFCSRSSVYRIVRLYHAKQLGFTVDGDGPWAAPVRTTVLMPWIQRSLAALLKASPRAYGWCRTRWSCATLALELHAKHRLEVSAWTVRRWLHELGWVWKRAKLVAKDNDPQRIERLARIRWQVEHLQAHEVLVFADALAIHLLPKIGAAWMPKGSQEEVMTPGQNEKHSLAGALNLATGKIHHCLGPRKNNALFRDLLTLLDRAYPERQVRRISVVVDNYKIHKAKAVEQWLATHPRFALLWLPTYCPRANPIERAFGDVHDKCTRNHKRKRLRDVIGDVERHLHTNGPWWYKLSRLYQEPEVTAAVERIAAEAQAKRVACVYESYAL
jgi:putative transposase